jgi:hypothetical protein
VKSVHISPVVHRLATGAAIGVPLALLALVAAARQAPVLDRGQLLPWFENYEHVARVRLAGVELYVDTSSGVADLMTVLALAAIAGLFALGAVGARRDPGLRRTFTIAAFGAAYLSADDLLGVHETVGHNLGFLAGLPLVDHPDDVVMAVYGIAAAAFAWRRRSLLVGPVRRWWLVAACSGGLAIGHDVLPLHAGIVEEILEVVAGGSLLIAVVLVIRQSAVVRAPERAGYAASSTGYRRRIA